MVLTLDGDAELVANLWRSADMFLTIILILTNRIADLSVHLRTYFTLTSYIDTMLKNVFFGACVKLFLYR